MRCSRFFRIAHRSRGTCAIRRRRAAKGYWLVLDEVAVDEVRSLRFELLEPQRVGIKGTAGEGCSELVGDVVVDERVVLHLGTGVLRVADELELTGLRGVVVELELYGLRIDMGSERQPVGVNTSLGALVAEGDDVGGSSVEVEVVGSDLVGGEEEVGSTGSVARLQHRVHVVPVVVDLVIGGLR